MAVDPARVQAVFLAAAEEPSGAGRAAVLDRLCGGDDELRQRVQTLLRAHDAPGSFLGPTVGEPPAAEGPGTLIGPYKLLEQIGEGGFGIVFLAEQQQPVRRKVALKVLKPGMDTRSVVARFEAERQALALMDHPNIARVFDGGATESGRPYFVMELVKGVAITDFCDHNRLAPRQRLGLFVAVCSAVQHAHTKGIIHRDLKPSNVLVSRHDTTPVVKVIDFGVAKALGQQLTDKTLFTGVAQMVGTPLYMSPEQAGMSDLDVDTRSDIYSLGVLLYELLTGTTPFTKERFKKAGYDEIRRIIREEDPPRPSTRLSEAKDTLPSVAAHRQTEPGKLTRLVRGELDWIVMKALEKDRSRRYETPSGFAADVQRFLADEPVLACPPSGWYRLGKFARRNKRVLTMAGALLLALLLAVGSLATATAVLVRSNAQIEVALSEKTNALDDLREEKQKADDALAAEQSAAYLRSVSVAHLAFLSDDLDLANEALDERPVQQRHWEWHYLKRLCHQGEVLYRTLGSVQRHQVVLSADGRLAAQSVRDALWVVETRSQKRILTLRGPRELSLGQLSFSPDGRHLALNLGGALRIWDLTTGRQTHQVGAAAPRTNPLPVAFQPQGRLVAWAAGSQVRLLDLQSGREAQGLPIPPLPPASLLFTADGQRLVSVHVSNRAVIKVWDVARGVVLQEHVESFAMSGLALSPDGRRYVVCTLRALKVCDLDTGRVVQILPAPNLIEPGEAGRVSLQFSADGGRLLSGSKDGTARVWDLTTGQEVRRFLSPRALWYAGFLAGGRRVLTLDAGGTARVRDIDSAPHGLAVRLPVAGPPDVKEEAMGIRAATFSPDGRHLAVAWMDGTVRVVAIETGATVLDLPNQGSYPIGGVAFGPGGQCLATTVFRERVVNVWDARTGRPLARLACRTGSPGSVAFSPDGRQLAAQLLDDAITTCDYQVWETGSWREVATRPGGKFVAVARAAYSPDGPRLALTRGGDQVTVWDTASGTDALTLREPGASFSGVAFSPRHGFLAAGTGDGAVYLWDAAGQRRAVLRGRPSRVNKVAFSPDGRRLACSVFHSTVPAEIRLWDVESGRMVLRLEQDHLVGWLEFSPDGRHLMTASASGPRYEVRIWDGTPWEPNTKRR